MVEDRDLREERADADEKVRDEREEHVALLRVEREETDKDLSRERARADAALATAHPCSNARDRTAEARTLRNENAMHFAVVYVPFPEDAAALLGWGRYGTSTVGIALLVSVTRPVTKLTVA